MIDQVNFERIFSLSSILKAPMPQIDWLVDPLIAHGNRVMFFGESGCGKSWLMLDLAIALASGKLWLGHYAVPQPRTVLYLDEEMSQNVLRRRLKQLGGEVETQEDGPDRLWFGSHLGVHFTDAMQTQVVLSELKTKGYDPDVIFVDTFRKVFAGNENDSGEVGKFWESIEPFLVEGKTFIVTHHMKKPSPNGSVSPIHMASGSTNIIGQLDAAYAVTRRGNTLILECVKSRDTEEPSPFMVGLYDVDGPEPSVELRFLSTKDGIEESPSMVNLGVQFIKALLAESEQETYKTGELNEVLKSNGITAEKTAERVLKECANQGVLEKVYKGVWKRKTTDTAA